MPTGATTSRSPPETPRPFPPRGLLADLQPGNQIDVAGRIPATDIVQQSSPPADQHQQATPAGMVLDVLLQVIGQLVDSLRQNGDLHIGRTGVSLRTTVILNELRLPIFGNRHDLGPHFRRPTPPDIPPRRQSPGPRGFTSGG